MIRGDLHIHTVLSPCGDIEMTPSFIVRKALDAGFDFIGITDHNSTRQYPQVKAIADREGLTTLCGAEITTREEIHILAFVPDGKIDSLQSYIDHYIIRIANDPDIFGYQLVVDSTENVLYEEPYLLTNAIDQTIEEVGLFIRSAGGIFIPAHIDKGVYSVTSQLGFVPPGLDADAYELSRYATEEEFLALHPTLSGQLFITGSDAHYPNDFGRTYVEFDIEDATFETIREYIKSYKR